MIVSKYIKKGLVLGPRRTHIQACPKKLVTIQIHPRVLNVKRADVFDLYIYIFICVLY